VQVVILGAGAEPVTVSSPDLPAFATMSGTTLNLAPGTADLGVHSFTLVATSGKLSDRAEMTVVVERGNTAPSLKIAWLQDADSGDVARELLFNPRVTVSACDAESDPLTVELEVTPAADPFSGIPTQTAPCAPLAPGDCCWARVPLEVVPGARYKARARARDDLGGVSDWRPAGTVFVAGPCAGPCPDHGVAWDNCLTDADCHSGGCVATPSTPIPLPHVMEPARVCTPCLDGLCPGGGDMGDPCASGADCKTGQCSLVAAWWRCTGTVGEVCPEAVRSWACLDPTMQVCRIATPTSVRCSAE
jgi:hypothetical protein